MNRTASALLPWALALATGCLSSSEVQLQLHVTEAALQEVDLFPARVIVDMGRTDNYEVHICDWEAGFLETEIDVATYDKCPEPLTIEAVLIPLTDACNDGAFRFTKDWPIEGTLLFGEGSLDVFEEGYCNTIEQRQLVVDPAQ